MKEVASIIIPLMVVFNAAWFAGVAFFIRSLFTSPAMAKLVKETIENGDDHGNHEDGTRATIIFFAYVTGWFLVNITCAGLCVGLDGWWMGIIGAFITLLLGLLGLKKIT